MLAASDYASACELSYADCGKRLSKQTWAIWPKIRDFDEARPDHDRLVEAHPEVSFRYMTGRVLSSKHTVAGLHERSAALRQHYQLDDALGRVPRGPGLDDALDALACAWTAQRWLRGEAEVLGDEADALGVPMRIVV